MKMPESSQTKFKMAATKICKFTNNFAQKSTPCTNHNWEDYTDLCDNLKQTQYEQHENLNKSVRVKATIWNVTDIFFIRFIFIRHKYNKYPLDKLIKIIIKIK